MANRLWCLVGVVAIATLTLLVPISAVAQSCPAATNRPDGCPCTDQLQCANTLLCNPPGICCIPSASEFCGGDCAKCPNGEACAVNADCLSGLCATGFCVARSPAPALSHPGLTGLAVLLAVSGFFLARRRQHSRQI